MLDENLIATLEQSLRQTRNAQHRLMSRLNEVEGEANRLRQEIDALNNSAKQTEAAIISLLETMRSGSQNWDLSKHLKFDENYDIEEIRRPMRNNQMPPPKNRPQNNQKYSNNQQNYSGNQNYSNNSYRDYPDDDYPQSGYMSNSRHVPTMEHNIEPISNRFADRTITQACKLLLGESGKPLHVNELFNLLVASGMIFNGNNPTISIAVSLNRNRHFRKVAPGTFDLVKRDASQANS